MKGRGDPVWRVAVAALLLAAAVFGIRALGADAPPPSVRPKAIVAEGHVHPLEAESGDEVVHRSSVPIAWAPDGRIWVRATDSATHAAVSITATWVNANARSYEALDASMPASEGWNACAPCDNKDLTCLAISASGYATEWLVDVEASKPHDIVLRRDQGVLLRVVDASSGAGVDGVAVCLSKMPFAASEWSPGCLPGRDERWALHCGVSAAGGLVRLASPSSGLGDYGFEIAHDFYVVASNARSRIVLAGGNGVIEVQMPYIGAVRYVGDTLVSGTVTVGQAASAGERTMADLEQIRTRVRSQFANSLVAVFVRPVDAVSVLADVEARATLAGSGERADRVEPVRLDEFKEPQEVVVTAALGAAVVLSDVTICRPEDFGGGADAEFSVLVTSTGEFAPRVVRFGQTIKLPVGRYRLTGSGTSARAALSTDLFEVKSADPVTFTAQWKADVRHYDVEIVSARAIGKVGCIYDANGTRCAAEARVDANGHAHFWLRHDLASIQIVASGYLPCDVMVTNVLGTRVFRGRCSMSIQ